MEFVRDLFMGQAFFQVREYLPLCATEAVDFDAVRFRFFVDLTDQVGDFVLQLSALKFESVGKIAMVGGFGLHLDATIFESL